MESLDPPPQRHRNVTLRIIDCLFFTLADPETSQTTVGVSSTYHGRPFATPVFLDLSTSVFNTTYTHGRAVRTWGRIVFPKKKKKIQFKLKKINEKNLRTPREPPVAFCANGRDSEFLVNAHDPTKRRIV